MKRLSAWKVNKHVYGKEKSNEHFLLQIKHTILVECTWKGDLPQVYQFTPKSLSLAPWPRAWQCSVTVTTTPWHTVPCCATSTSEGSQGAAPRLLQDAALLSAHSSMSLVHTGCSTAVQLCNIPSCPPVILLSCLPGNWFLWQGCSH